MKDQSVKVYYFEIDKKQPATANPNAKTVEAYVKKLDHDSIVDTLTSQFKKDFDNINESFNGSNAKIAKLTEALEYCRISEKNRDRLHLVDSATLVKLLKLIDEKANEALKSCSQYDEQTEECV